MSDEERRESGLAVYRDVDDRAYRRELNRAIAASIRFREATVARLPPEKRVEYLLRSVQPDDDLASTLLLALHVGRRTELLGVFLDGLGIPHDGGMIDPSHELSPPADETLVAVVDELRARFPAKQVALYLAALLAMDAGTWSGLRRLLAGGTASA